MTELQAEEMIGLLTSIHSILNTTYGKVFSLSMMTSTYTSHLVAVKDACTIAGAGICFMAGLYSFRLVIMSLSRKNFL